jgi:hypothetical protein
VKFIFQDPNTVFIAHSGIAIAKERGMQPFFKSAGILSQVDRWECILQLECTFKTTVEVLAGISVRVFYGYVMFFMNVFAVTVPTDLIRQSPIQRNHFRLYAKHLPHRSIENDFAVVGTRQKKNRQRKKKKKNEGAFKKFHHERDQFQMLKQQINDNILGKQG